MNQNLRTHVLKKGCLLCLSFCLWAGSALLAQNTSISLRVKDKPLKEVLNQIETDEGYIFLYKDKTMDLERKISLDVRNASLETILRRILDEKTNSGFPNGRSSCIRGKRLRRRLRPIRLPVRLPFGERSGMPAAMY